MGKVFIQESTLTSIGDAIRAKSGKSDLISPTSMATEIANLPSGGGGGDIEIPVITGDCANRFARGGWDWVIENFGDQLTTEKITSANSMFSSSKVEEIPFDINFDASINPATSDTRYMFSFCENLKVLPKLNNYYVSKLQGMFSNCKRLKEFPENWFDNWDWSYLNSQTGQYAGETNELLLSCYSLRKFPVKLFTNGNPNAYGGNCSFYSALNGCASMDEVIDLPNPHYNATMIGNSFYNTFRNCYRLKEITFKMPDGKPYVVNWKSQLIDLSNNYTGYVHSAYKAEIINYNSGITADKEVKDDTTYQALKNDPDWFTADKAYSRYNKTSAINTINSLPDASAYLASNGGTNTIRFLGAAGSATDGGAINTMTEEEIAVAAAKGWTVSFV